MGRWKERAFGGAQVALNYLLANPDVTSVLVGATPASTPYRQNFSMKPCVFWTGIVSVAAGLALQSTSIAPLLMPSAPPGMLIHLFGAMAVFLGIMLILCSRDLDNRAALVAWEGVLRLCGFGIMAGFGLFAGGGMQLVLAGFYDLVIGVAYLALLPRALGITLGDLLLDRRK